jgi:hypothetical protein
MRKKSWAKSIVKFYSRFCVFFCLLFIQENMEFEMWNVIVWTVLLPFMKIAWIVLCEAHESEWKMVFEIILKQGRIVEIGTVQGFNKSYSSLISHQNTSNFQKTSIHVKLNFATFCDIFCDLSKFFIFRSETESHLKKTISCGCLYTFFMIKPQNPDAI